MKSRRVFLVWGLLASGLLLVGLAMASTWYGLASDSLSSGFDADSFNPFNPGQRTTSSQRAPDYQLHTTFVHDAHQQDEGGSGRTLDYETVPWIASVMEVTRPFFVLGALGLLAAAIALVLRMRGLVDGRGIIATLAILSIASLVYGVGHFSASIAPAYNQELEDGTDVSPEIAFWTFGTSSSDGLWKNVTSGPQVGWYFAVLGTTAATGGFVVAYASDLRRAREILVDDQAARAAQDEARARQGHVLDRIRGEGRP